MTRLKYRIVGLIKAAAFGVNKNLASDYGVRLPEGTEDYGDKRTAMRKSDKPLPTGRQASMSAYNKWDKLKPKSTFAYSPEARLENAADLALKLSPGFGASSLVNATTGAVQGVARSSKYGVLPAVMDGVVNGSQGIIAGKLGMKTPSADVLGGVTDVIGEASQAAAKWVGENI